MVKLLIASVVLLAALTCTSNAAEFPSCSGVAQLADGHFLLVDDVKGDSTAPRLRVATLSPGGSTITAVNENWGDNAPPSDLEAIAPIPGQPGRFLVSESGYWNGQFGRLFYIEVSGASEQWSSRVFGVAQLPTWLHGEVEAIAVGAKPEGGLVLVLVERGGAAAYTPAQLWWGDFDLSTGAFTLGQDAQWGIQLAWPDKTCSPWARPCTDLFLDAGGYLWASGAQDMGDAGPFRSVIYRIGRFDPRQPWPVMYEMNLDLTWYIDGLKIEALGPAVVAGSILTYFTDDEAHGGLWRPLPPAEFRQREPVYPYGGH